MKRGILEVILTKIDYLHLKKQLGTTEQPGTTATLLSLIGSFVN